jgi:hypothetical protein
MAGGGSINPHLTITAEKIVKLLYFRYTPVQVLACLSTQLMKLSRRQFVSYALVAIGAGTLETTIGDYRKLIDEQVAAHPALEPGPLAADVLENLMAMVEAFAGDYGPLSHYETYFSWRAENLPEYRSIYTLFSASLDGAAQAAGEQSYAASDRDTRRRILQHGMDLPQPSSPLFAPRVSLRQWTALSPQDRLWIKYDRYVVAEMVRVFIDTNAWVMLGYDDGWPGRARGLVLYTRPVEDGA